MAIKVVALDVDGVFTDGGVWLGPGGEEFKRLNFRDIMGVFRGRQAGLEFMLISGEGGPLLDCLAAKLGIRTVYGHCRDKGAVLRSFTAANRIEPGAVCYLGDDVNDLDALAFAGISACPADAHPRVRACVHWVLKTAGGHGAVRELIDRLLEGEQS